MSSNSNIMECSHCQCVKQTRQSMVKFNELWDSLSLYICAFQMYMYVSIYGKQEKVQVIFSVCLFQLNVTGATPPGC